MNWVMRRWRERQRAIDLQVLWPACVENAGGDLDLARAAFAAHAYHDKAWLCLGEEEIFRRVDALGPPATRGPLG
jgi:hypothetical protein